MTIQFESQRIFLDVTVIVTFIVQVNSFIYIDSREIQGIARSRRSSSLPLLLSELLHNPLVRHTGHPELPPPGSVHHLISGYLVTGRDSPPLAGDPVTTTKHPGAVPGPSGQPLLLVLLGVDAAGHHP